VTQTELRPVDELAPDDMNIDRIRPQTVDVSPAKVISSKKKFGVPFWIATGWLALVGFCAIFGKWLPMVKPNPPDYLLAQRIVEGDWTHTFSWSHPLSANGQGNDILSYLILGSRNSIIIAFTTIILGFFLGGVLGMVAGYRKGRFDSVMSYIVTVLLSIPPLLFILLLVAVLSAKSSDGIEAGLSTTVWKLSLSLGILFIPSLFRVVRGATMSFAGREFVVAARAMGAKTPRILLREILPNVAKPMLAFGLVGAGNVMVVEGALSFLGVGVNGPAWGRMIYDGSSFADLRLRPHVAFIPAMVLFLTVLSFNFVGDKVRERLEVKEGNI
jgi:peptide/nickel transport system permease protein